MRSSKYFCDRCGKEILSEYMPKKLTLNYDSSIDLCSDCYSVLNKWIKEKDFNLATINDCIEDMCEECGECDFIKNLKNKKGK